MKTFKIRLSDGKWVEQFQAIAVCVTDNEKRAGSYSKSIAIKRMLDRNISDYTLIENCKA